MLDNVLILQGGNKCQSHSWKRKGKGFSSFYFGPFGCGGLMVSVLDSGFSGPGWGPGRGHCVVFLGKTLYSHGSSLHPGV